MHHNYAKVWQHRQTSVASNGRKRVIKWSWNREDCDAKRLKTMVGNNFVYHMRTNCYKPYTPKKNQCSIQQQR